MRERLALAVAIGVCCLCVGQEKAWEDEPPLFTEVREDLDYIELLNTIGLTRKQLVALQNAQEACQEGAVLTPEVEETVDEIFGYMLAGKSKEDAISELGQRQKGLREMQQAVHTTVQSGSRKLLEMMSAEQRRRFFLYNSPGRALTSMLEQIGRARKAPLEHWQGFRKGMTAALLNASRQTGTKGVTAETVQGLIDAARTMEDGVFKTKQASLVEEWGKVLMPGLLERANNAKTRDSALLWSCNRLVTYYRGAMLVELKLDSIPKKD